MKILLYGINFLPELTGAGKYTGELGAWLAENGHQVQVITAPPYYPEWKIGDGYSGSSYANEEIGNMKITRCPVFIPSSLNTKNRILHLLSFALSSSPIVLSKFFWKPNVIICIAPTLFCAPLSILLSRISQCPCVLHLQDFEVDSMFGLDMLRKGILSRIAYWAERHLLRRSNFVSTISSSMLDRAIEKGVKSEQTILFPNWSEVGRFSSITPTAINSLKRKLKLSASNKICLYSGNIGEKQGLEIVIEIAQSFQLEPVDFIFVGAGSGLDRLKYLASEYSLSNVIFLPIQPYRDLPALLACADCHLIIQKPGIADAVLPSKLTNILAAGGNVIITAEPDTELGHLCENNPGIAVCVEPENKQAIENGIREILLKTGKNALAQTYAETHLDKNVLLEEFELVLKKIADIS